MTADFTQEIADWMKKLEEAEEAVDALVIKFPFHNWTIPQKLKLDKARFAVETAEFWLETAKNNQRMFGKREKA